MYYYIKGIITGTVASGIVIENNGVGYFVKTPNPFSFTLHEELTLYTHLHVREDIFELYGFRTQEEKDFFIKLISVKGLGPKGALAILASGDTHRLEEAILSSDVKYLQRFPGIGPKASSQIILDLQGKLAMASSATEHPKVKNVKEALRFLGYNPGELKKIDSFIQANLDLSIEELVKQSLRKLL
ncbi:MAG: Holliday junction branch migration protein RuvA [Bacilli bacterium]|nr:Holliday junction branch migration protein RuvA [Bacilli bacterium]